MTTQRNLGYESQKIIMKYLDPNSRIFLYYKCPSLQKINKMMPINIDTVRFCTSGLKINNSYYDILRNCVDDTFFYNSKQKEVIIENLQLAVTKFRKRETLESVKSKYSVEQALNYLLERFFFWNEVKIRKMNVEFDRFKNIPLPFRSQSLTVRQLSITWDVMTVLDKLQPLLTSKSLPFDVLKLDGLTDADHLLIRSSKTLYVTGELNLNVLRLSNTTVVWDTWSTWSCKEYLVRRLINNWQARKYPIGRSHSIQMDSSSDGYTTRHLNSVMESIGHMPLASKRVFEQYGNQHYAYAFPVTDSTELNVFARLGTDLIENRIFATSSKYSMNFVITEEGFARYFPWSCQPL